MSTATSAPIVPGPTVPLQTFVENSLTSIYQAVSTDDFNTAFDDFYAQSLSDITLNGQKLTRAQYQNAISTQRPNFEGLPHPAQNIVFNGIVVTPLTSGSQDNTTGFAGVFYTATFTSQPTDNGPVVTLTLTSSLTITVKEDDTIKGPVFEERRRVFSVDQVAIEVETNPSTN